MTRIVTLVAGAAFAAVLPLSVSFSPTNGLAAAGDLIRLNTACAEEDGGRGCEWSPTSICETIHADHYGYRNNDATVKN